jgi:hypothetical protein
MEETYTVIAYSFWEKTQIWEGLSKEDKDSLVFDLRNQQYKVEVKTDKEYQEELKIAEEIISEIIQEEKDSKCSN